MLSSEEKLVIVTLLWLVWKRVRQSKNRRRCWVRARNQCRRVHGADHCLVRQLSVSDKQGFFSYLRMTPTTFESLLQIVGPRIAHPRAYRTSSARRPEISPQERLALTLRYLVTGNSQTSLAFEFHMGKSTVNGIVRETCAALWETLKSEFVKFPANEEEWRGIAKRFESRWNFPRCLGAIDGKHVIIQAPSHAGSSYYNYKGTHSIVLMAVVDANYRFIYVDIGNYGRQSDGGIFSNSTFGASLERETLNLPLPAELLIDGKSKMLPYVFVGDEAFPLKKNLLRPFPGRNLPNDEALFNYRLAYSFLAMLENKTLTSYLD